MQQWNRLRSNITFVIDKAGGVGGSVLEQWAYSITSPEIITSLSQQKKISPCLVETNNPLRKIKSPA
jgi:hypothetical protein